MFDYSNIIRFFNTLHEVKFLFSLNVYVKHAFKYQTLTCMREIQIQSKQTLQYFLTQNERSILFIIWFWKLNKSHVFCLSFEYSVDCRYLELGYMYLEFCETQKVYLNQKYILIDFSNHNYALDTFLHVQITRSANFG